MQEVFIMVTRDDVAKLACVSGATVSRVFNNPQSVSQATRDRVLKAAKELNYHPNVIASNFTKGISGNIGVVVPKIPKVHVFSVYYFAELLSGIGEALSEHGYNLVLFFHDISSILNRSKISSGIADTSFDNISSSQIITSNSENLASDSENSASHLEVNNFDNKSFIISGGNYEKYFTGGKVDGCILLGTYYNDPEIIKLKQRGYKFCLINNYMKDLDINFIDVDNVKGSINAINYLVSLGHKNIAFLNGPAYFINSIDRLKGYKIALESNGISFNKSLVLEGNYGRKSGYYAAKKILKLENRPTAVFVANDRMAVGLIQGLTEANIKVPEDISVLGYDDSDVATLITPSLTTMRISFYELGKRCATEFIKYILNNENIFNIFVEPELVIRKSTAINFTYKLNKN